MIQNMHDICKLVALPDYQTTYMPFANDGKGKKATSFNIVNKSNSLDYIHVEICQNIMEISKFTNMNSEYYERISTNTKQGKKIYDLFMTKRFAAMRADIEQHSK